MEAEAPARIIEPVKYAGFARRIIRSLGRRCAEQDPWQLQHVLQLRDDVDAAIAVAVRGLRAEGYSWADIARPLGMTRQGAFKVYGPACADIPNPNHHTGRNTQ